STIRNQFFKEIENGEYETSLIREVLYYEQPNNYIVFSTDYLSDNTLIPVLTANKAFILGYTDENFGVYDKGECIIFDDFTMDMKYVHFPFKLKSSAIKILKSKHGSNLKFIFEYLLFLDLISNEHKRHYISEIESMKIPLINIEIQDRISRLLSTIDEKIRTDVEANRLLIQQKQYLLGNSFI
ncbi:restriction endonuclease subunit S, partial [Emticicia sp. BO119]|uniref:restriction endonuclease subunit S n=1 Tax=Emticicia sp. BO119 TaxID=2757768 RepID=UPI0015F01A7D